MGRLRNVITLGRAGSGASGVERTPTRDDFTEWHNAIYNGRGKARGFGRATLLDAVHGLNCMLTRDPHRLLRLRDADDVAALIQYARERQVARLVPDDMPHTCGPGINYGCDRPDCDGDVGD